MSGHGSQTCTPGAQPNSAAIGRMATDITMRSMLHSMSASAVGKTTRTNLSVQAWQGVNVRMKCKRLDTLRRSRDHRCDERRSPENTRPSSGMLLLD